MAQSHGLVGRLKLPPQEKKHIKSAGEGQERVCMGARQEQMDRQ